MASIKLPKYNGHKLIQFLMEDIKNQKLVLRKHLRDKDVRKLAKNLNKSMIMFKGSLYTMIKYLNELDMLDLEGFNFSISSKYTESNDPAPVSSYKFKVRFITRLYVYLLNNVDDIVEFEFGIRGKRPIKDRYEIFYQIVDSIGDFTTAVLTGKKDSVFAASYMKVYELCNIGKPKKEERLKVVDKTVVKQLDIIKSSQVSIPGFKFLEMKLADDKIIHNLSKIAYVISTNDIDVSKTGKFIKNLEFEDKEAMYALVSNLGRAVRRNHKQHGEPIIWQLFFDSYPKINSSFELVTEDKNLVYGCNALALTAFVSGNDVVRNLISKMLQ